MHYILLAFLLISTSAFANDSTWLCIGEHLATVSETNGVTNSESFLNNEKFIITKDGLKNFGSDYVVLDSCTRDKNGRPTWCKRSDGSWAGNFIMQENKVFFLSGVGKLKNGGTQLYWVAGKCSQL